MDDRAYYHNENLRSISAIVAARNKQIYDKKLSLPEDFTRPSKISKHAVNIIEIHRCSIPIHSNSRKISLESNKTKKLLWRSSKVAPDHNNTFYFDDRSDLTLSDVLSNRIYQTKKDHRNSDKIKSRRRSKCITIIICLLATFIIIIISIVVSVALATPSHT